MFRHVNLTAKGLKPGPYTTCALQTYEPFFTSAMKHLRVERMNGGERLELVEVGGHRCCIQLLPLQRQLDARSASLRSTCFTGAFDPRPIFPPSIDVAECELCFLRAMETCIMWSGEDILLECIEMYLQLNDGQMPNLKKLQLKKPNLALVA